MPRDYQNAPPAMTHPAQTKTETPTDHGMPAAAPEPSKGVEGKDNGKPVEPAPNTTLKDQAPATTTR